MIGRVFALFRPLFVPGHGGIGVLIVAVAGAVPQQALRACPTSGDGLATIAAVESRLELRLTDGRLARLVGLDPPSETPNDPDLGETLRARLAARLQGKEVSLQILARTPDRWGRLPVLAFLTEGEDAGLSGGIAAAAVAAGLGRYQAEAAGRACRDELIAAEVKARLAKLGLWNDPYYAVLAVDDRSGFMERAGTTILAEGLLASVQPGPYRTILRFAKPSSTWSGGDTRILDQPGQNGSGQSSYGGHMLVATIMPHAMKIFEAKQVDLQGLIGRRLRFRGLLDLRFGPQVELASPDQIEPIEAAAPPSPN